ncbi:hypothetical protein AB0C96_38995 [Streptomyces sp. NPDC048506]|uniref:hypothetical protein n=1 Tax=Streptomyces sp. NPDC048506 TaxID=3155028 RepID=UPI0034492671
MAHEIDIDAVLRAADRAQGTDHLEFPHGFDRRRALARVQSLVERLQTGFGCQCVVDTAVQDASFHAVITVPAEATGAGERITVRLSNFGDFAVIAAENPGCYLDLDEAETEGALTLADRRTAEAAAASLGYVLIPEPALRRPYDGVTPLGEHSSPYGEATWWIRFFDYL